MATPGLEQAVLLVLDIEPLFIFISFCCCCKQLQTLVSQHLLSDGRAVGCSDPSRQEVLT